MAMAREVKDVEEVGDTLDDFASGADLAVAGREMYRLIEELYPVCRSITGNGVRQTLERVKREVPIVLHEVPTGTAVYDWTIPKEWNVRDAYVIAPNGRKVIDFKNSNLHVVGYSVPVRTRMTLTELKSHLYTLPEHPDWIPYRTSYYTESWGFCLSHRELQKFPEGEYEVFIDSTLADGSLTYGECFLPGNCDDEVLFFTHICHPSLCNDNLSGIALATNLAKILAGRPRHYGYRFVFAPTTIGSIAWLSRNEELFDRIKHGLVIAVVGDPGPLTYKKSRYETAVIDRAVLHALDTSGKPYNATAFSPWGYDERQFGSPGVRLPIGRLTRSPNGQYPEYHTSADDLKLVRPDCLAESLEIYLKVVEILEYNAYFINQNPKGEPQLGRRGLYRRMGGQQDIADRQLAMLWVLNQSTGQTSLLDIAERANLSFTKIYKAALELESVGLLLRTDQPEVRETTRGNQ